MPNAIKVPDNPELRAIYEFLLSQGWESFDQIVKQGIVTPYNTFEDAVCFLAEDGQLVAPLMKDFLESDVVGVFDWRGMKFYDCHSIQTMNNLVEKLVD